MFPCLRAGIVSRFVDSIRSALISRGRVSAGSITSSMNPRSAAAYGGAYDVMSSKHIRGDLNLAWPTAEIAVMGGQGAVNILYRTELKQAEAAGEDIAAVRTRLANEYTYNVASPFLAAERGELDGVIEPAATRVQVIKGLRALRGKRASLPPKKHGNIPL